MQITKQLAIFLDNRPGTLARLADALAEAKINIYAITTSDTVDHSVIRLVVSDYRKAIHVFEEHGTLVVEDDVLMIEGSNKPGELARMARTLAAGQGQHRVLLQRHAGGGQEGPADHAGLEPEQGFESAQ